MAKKPSTKSRQPQQETEQTIFEQLAAVSFGDNDPGTDAQEQTGEQGKEQQQGKEQELLAKIAALEARLGSLSAPLPQRTEPTPPAAPGVLKLDGLPDPTVDPEGYARELQTRMADHQRQQVDYNNWQNDQRKKEEGRTAALWQDFAIKYGDYAEDKAKAEFAAQQVAQRAMARNIDVGRYMFEHTDRFLAEVVQVYDQVFGKPGQDEDEPDETTRPATRTAGIFGGQESGGKPAGGKQPPQSDMIKELHDVQRKLGLY